MSRFKPVELTRRLDGRVSITMLKKYALCPRSAYFYAEYRDTPAQTKEMTRGTAFHTIAQRSVEAMIHAQEAVIPPELVKAIADEVLSEFYVPLEEHDSIREMSYRWAQEMAVAPNDVICCEHLLAWEIAGYQVRGRIDFAETCDDGMRVIVKDWKTSRAAPSFEEIARKRPDGSYAAKNAQLVLYALLLAFGVPVRVETCPQCDGKRHREFPNPGGPPDGEICDHCEGRGVIEHPEPFPLAGRAQTFDLEYVYPAIEDREGHMVRRTVSLTRAELDEYRVSLTGLLIQLRDSEETGDWPAVISDAACGECPCPSECPIPRELRDHRGAINTVSQAAESAEVVDRTQAVLDAVRKELKAFSKTNGPVRYGHDKVLDFTYTESERIPDKDALFAAIERERMYGEPFERADFVKRVKSTRFGARTLTADELAAEAAGGSTDASDRWGDSASF